MLALTAPSETPSWPAISVAQAFEDVRQHLLLARRKRDLPPCDKIRKFLAAFVKASY
jgi:hypothetical protein